MVHARRWSRLGKQSGCGKQKTRTDGQAFHIDIFLRAEPCFCWEGPDRMIVAQRGPIRELARENRVKTLL